MELAIWSAALDSEEVPVSILLVGSPENGKSRCVLQFDSPWLKVFSAFTAWGLINRHFKLMSTVPAGEVWGRVLVVSDLTALLSHGSAVSDDIFKTLMLYQTDGIRQIQSFHTQFDMPRPLRGSVIAACTTDQFQSQRKVWNKSGFTSRFLVISWRYDEDTLREISHQIWYPPENDFSKIKLPIPLMQKPVATPLNYEHLLEVMAKEYVANLGLTQDAYGNRFREAMRRLVKAHALRRGSEVVEQIDIERVAYLVEKYANLKFNVPA